MNQILEKFFTNNYAWDTSAYKISESVLTLEILECGKNQILYGVSLTDKEILKDQLTQTKVGKILYG
jgi:hypothetical protein